MRNVTDIEPFVLYYDRDKPWLDVPHLLLRSDLFGLDWTGSVLKSSPSK